jgi:TPR repeat protein
MLLAFLVSVGSVIRPIHAATISPIITSDVTGLRQKADAGDPQAQDALGEAFYQHNEYATAVSWFRKAAEQGVANSQWRLGTMVLGGKKSLTKDTAVERNAGEAVMWFFKAASQGHEPSQVALGDRYFAGGILATNWVEAYKWYVRAAEQGSVDGRTKMNLLMLNMSEGELREGERRAALPVTECDVCRRLLEEERNPAATLELKGITGFPQRPLALINGQVFAEGEEAVVTLWSRKVRVKCLKIRENAVRVEAEGKQVDLVLASHK